MKKSMITKIAKKLGWTYQDTSKAINDVLSQQTIISDWEEFFKICISAETPVDRWIEAKKFLKQSLADHLQLYPLGDDRSRCDDSAVEKYVELISDWLFKLDPAFNALAAFNIADRLNSDRPALPYRRTLFPLISIKTKGAFYFKQSFIPNFVPMPIEPTSGSLLEPAFLGHFLGEDFLVQPATICDQFLDELLGPTPIVHSHTLSILFNLASKHGYMVFNLKTFRTISASFSYNPRNIPVAKELTDAFHKSIGAWGSKRDHWLYYILVEELKEECGFNGACREVGRLCRVQNRKETKEGKKIIYGPTIKSRYFERKKAFEKIQAENPVYDLDDLIRDHALGPAIEEYRQKHSKQN